ncbi:hypothetical protein MTO96_031753 [Rhipicephalus appendiculatus]
MQTVDTLANEETYVRRAARNMRRLNMTIKKPNLPVDDIKVIVRPRDGFSTATHRAARIGDSIRDAAGLEARRQEFAHFANIGARSFSNSSSGTGVSFSPIHSSSLVSSTPVVCETSSALVTENWTTRTSCVALVPSPLTFIAVDEVVSTAAGVTSSPPDKARFA